MGRVIDKATGRGFRFIDRAGTRNFRTLVVGFAGVAANGRAEWDCACDCGNTFRTQYPMKIKSCGCLQREVAAENARRRSLPDDIRAQHRRDSAKKQRDKRKRNPLVAMQARLSRLHRHALDRVGGIKTSPTFVELGYSVDEFCRHIERQFLPGMGWDNMSEWHIDHIIPSSTAVTPEDVVRLNQLSNLRPLWSSENIRKRDSLENLI